MSFTTMVIFNVIMARVYVSLFIFAGEGGGGGGWGSNVHKNPDPLSFCHWNFGGLSTDNFSKKILLQAFLYVNENCFYKFDIEGYCLTCDHPCDTCRGDIGVYYKSSISCIFKQELTKPNETLVFQVKSGTGKCFFTCIYRHQSFEK